MRSARVLLLRRTLRKTLGIAAVFAALLGGMAMAAGAAEPVVRVLPGPLSTDGDVREWLDRPPTWSLQVSAAGERSGRVWVAQAEPGLVVAGSVSGPALGIGDHLLLKVALADDVAMPKVGWGGDLAPVELERPESCSQREEFAGDANATAECESWYREQVAYRRQFRNLFVRSWEIAPGRVAETLARPAFATFDEQTQESLQPLAPSTLPSARFAASESGPSFEILVPWDALPPAPALELSRLYLLLEVVSTRQSGAPTAGASLSADGNPRAMKAMQALQLDPPRRWRIGPCGYALEAPDLWGQRTLPGYFLPTDRIELDQIFVIENTAAGGQGRPDGMSPSIRTSRFFYREIAPGITMCGPPLAIRRGDRVTAYPDYRLRSGVHIKPLPDGWLIAEGPYVGVANPLLATDDCSGCPSVILQVLFLPAVAGPPTTAFRESWLIENGDPGEGERNARVTLDPEMTLITAWEGEAPEDRPRVDWTRIRYCYDAVAHRFKECERTPHSPPPADLPLPPDEPPS